MPTEKKDPFKDILPLQDRLNQLFSSSMPGAHEQGQVVEGKTWLPSVDIYETKGAYVLAAEISGMSKKDVNIEIRGQTLVLKGDRKLSRGVKRENYHRIERPCGKFFREFELPGLVQAEKVQAKFEKGILEVRLPKKKKGKREQIEIKIK